MNENLNLVEILKDCPEGTKLYSTIFGEVGFEGVHSGSRTVVYTTRTGRRFDVTREGKMFEDYDGECTLFPSKEQRDWSKFTAPWLEKQGNITKLSEEEKNKFAKGVLTSCALSFINYLDAHKYEGKMCVSNGECEDIENAFHNAMWDRLHRYYCKYIEKQGEPNPYIGVSFKYNGRTWVMCARDGGVAILVDGEIKERIFLNNKPRGKSSLEALKEEKVDNANKVEPKFKVGDWVVNKFGDPWHIDSFDKKNYQVSDGKGNYNYFPISDQDEMLVSKKFDPKTLKPFDKVLVRDTYKKEWSCNFFSHISNDGVYYPYITLNLGYVFCIPYNEDTKHLVGTKEEAPEYYRYWED